ncbi:uncharacterized protein [Henckelia pumila]|uniref:uncharacterized protein isoform X5 n=1 Tax=Henckelia pumila TaxID=405737 RepID=UPI003C6E9C43
MKNQEHVAQIIDGSRTKAQTIVDAVMQEISSLKNTDDNVKKIENALGYANHHIPPDRLPYTSGTDSFRTNHQMCSSFAYDSELHRTACPSIRHCRDTRFCYHELTPPQFT